LVGSFSLSENITSTKLEAGESTTLTIKVQGNGDLKKLPSPEMKNNGDFKIYDDEPTIKVTPTAKGVRETKVFKKAIVPLRPGRLTIPTFKFSFFDPSASKYVVLTTQPVSLDVSPSSKPEQIIVSSGDGKGILKKELEVLGDDLMPIVKGVSALESEVLTKTMFILYIVLSTISFIAFILALLWYFRLQKVRADKGYIRRGKAFRKAHKEMRKLMSVSGSDFYTSASLVLRDYIGDKKNLDGRSLTAADISRRLEPEGATKETCEEIVAFLNECDAGLYGGKTFTEKERKTMTDSLIDLIKRLEKEFRK